MKNSRLKEELITNIHNLEEDLAQNTPKDDIYNIKILTGHYTNIIPPDKARNDIIGHNRYFITYDWLCNELNNLSFQDSRKSTEKNLSDDAAGDFLDIEIVKNGNESSRKTIILSNSDNENFFISPQNLKEEFENFENYTMISPNPFTSSNIEKFENEAKRIAYHTLSDEEQNIMKRL